MVITVKRKGKLEVYKVSEQKDIPDLLRVPLDHRARTKENKDRIFFFFFQDWSSPRSSPILKRLLHRLLPLLVTVVTFPRVPVFVNPFFSSNERFWTVYLVRNLPVRTV